MIILGIETSCDETAAAVLLKDDNGIHILSNVVASSASLQAKYGGIIPEQAAREQIKSIIPVIEEALNQANLNRHSELASTSYGTESKKRSRNKFGMTIPNIDAIAVTYGPGLIGSLLVGVETAKILATVWKKPLIPVNHLLGHFYANWISSSLRGATATKQSIKEIATGPSDPRNDVPRFPYLGLLVSGGHTDLVLFRDHGKYEYLGGTRDDAAGECFDKCARALGLSYPGGPEISKLAQKGNPSKFNLPSPLIHSKDFDFSFSGLKTAVANLITDCHVVPQSGTPRNDVADKADLAASIEDAIIKVLVEKTVSAAKQYNIDQIIVAGGVAANQKLQNQLRIKAEQIARALVFVPPPSLCTDNGAMIASCAFFNTDTIDPAKLQADPNLTL